MWGSNKKLQGAWVAQSAGSSPTSGSALTAPSLEPASDSVCVCVCVCVCAPPQFVLSLSLSL